MKIYLICPVRRANNKMRKEMDNYVNQIEKKGNIVHYPPREIDQENASEINIVKTHLLAMENCDEVHVFWMGDSRGSHTDIGMAMAFRKPLKLIKVFSDETGTTKNYLPILYQWNNLIYEKCI